MEAKDFVELQEKIIMNSLMINLIQTKFSPGEKIIIGTTISRTLPELKELLNKINTPKTVIYSIIGIYDKNKNAILVGLKYKDFEVFWKKEYSLEFNKTKDIVIDIFNEFPIHPAKTDAIFKKDNMPKSYKLFLARHGIANRWMCGYIRKNERNQEPYLTLDLSELESYKMLLQKTLSKYRVIVKILNNLYKTGYYSCENRCEKFSLKYNQSRKAIVVEYFYYPENHFANALIPIDQFVPVKFNSFGIPLIHLVYIVN